MTVPTRRISCRHPRRRPTRPAPRGRLRSSRGSTNTSLRSRCYSAPVEGRYSGRYSRGGTVALEESGRESGRGDTLRKKKAVHSPPE